MTWVAVGRKSTKLNENRFLRSHSGWFRHENHDFDVHSCQKHNFCVMFNDFREFSIILTMIPARGPQTELQCYCMLSYATVCYRMLSYAVVCYRMIAYATVCYRMLPYATVGATSIAQQGLHNKDCITNIARQGLRNTDCTTKIAQHRWHNKDCTT